MLDINRVHRQFEALVEGRMPWEALWRDVAKYYLPTSMTWASGGASRITTRRGQNVYDDTPAWAAQRFAAAMLGMMMNPSQKWLDFEVVSGETQNLSLESKKWLQLLSCRALSVMQDPELGMYDAMHEHLLDYGIFGEACMLIDRNPETKSLRFTPIPLEQCYIGMGSTRKPDTVFRRYEMTIQSIVDFFEKEKLPSEVSEAYEKGDFNRKFWVVHGVFPRKHGIAKGFDFKKPWASIYYLETNKKLLKESGFDFFPFSCPRFMIFANEEHGQGPGTMSLSNVRALNTIVKTLLVADQKIAAPAYVAQRRGWIKQLNLTPDAINYYDGFDIDKALMPIGNQGQPQAGQPWVEMYQNQIMRAFYLDRLNGNDKKAEVKEVEVLVDEDRNMRDLVPQLSRLHSESVSHIVENVVDFVMDTMPEPPDELAGHNLKIRYRSPLARAQQLLEVSNANRTMQQIILPYSQIDPNALKAVDTHKLVSWALDNSNFPADVRVSEEDYQAAIQADQQKQEMAQGLEAGQGAAQIAKDVSAAQKNTPGALSGFF